jgi:hypothetical protein
LLDLKAVESVPVIETAYSARKVDDMVSGSWAAVQVELGLKQASDFTAEELAIHYTPAQEKQMANIRAYLDRQTSKSSAVSLPTHRPGFEPAEFKDIAAQAGTQKLTAKTGFGGATPAGAKKGKHNKKK